MIPKSSKPHHLPSSSRAISLLSILSKFIEKLIFVRFIILNPPPKTTSSGYEQEIAQFSSVTVLLTLSYPFSRRSSLSLLPLWKKASLPIVFGIGGFYRNLKESYPQCFTFLSYICRSGTREHSWSSSIFLVLLGIICCNYYSYYFLSYPVVFQISWRSFV